MTNTQQPSASSIDHTTTRRAEEIHEAGLSSSWEQACSMAEAERNLMLAIDHPAAIHHGPGMGVDITHTPYAIRRRAAMYAKRNLRAMGATVQRCDISRQHGPLAIGDRVIIDGQTTGVIIAYSDAGWLRIAGIGEYEGECHEAPADRVILR